MPCYKHGQTDATGIESEQWWHGGSDPHSRVEKSDRESNGNIPSQNPGAIDECMETIRCLREKETMLTPHTRTKC